MTRTVETAASLAVTLLASTLLGSTLLGCATQGSDAEDIAAATAAAVFVEMSEGERLVLQESEPVQEPELVQRYYVDHDCARTASTKAARAVSPDAEYLFLEHLVRCEDGRTPSVVSVFEPGVDGSVEGALWLTTYGVGPSVDGGAIERIQVGDGVARPQRVAFGGATVLDELGLDAPALDPAALVPTAEPVYTHAFSFVASGTGTGDDCDFARARAGWETTAEAQATCFERGGEGSYALYSATPHLEIRQQEGEDGTCEVSIRVSYDCFSELRRAPTQLDAPADVAFDAEDLSQRVRVGAGTLFARHPHHAE
ncbi:MAG: hypothetical protein AB8I08_11545 [Sandaracinaceae bacterium]